MSQEKLSEAAKAYEAGQEEARQRQEQRLQREAARAAAQAQREAEEQRARQEQEKSRPRRIREVIYEYLLKLSGEETSLATWLDEKVLSQPVQVAGKKLTFDAYRLSMEWWERLDEEASSCVLWLVSRPGQGKTAAALYVLAEEILARFEAAKPEEAEGWITALKEGSTNLVAWWDASRMSTTGLKTLGDERSRAEKASFLVINDLGRDHLKADASEGYWAKNLWGLLDARIAAWLPIIVTTNYTMEQLQARFPDPIAAASMFDRIQNAADEVVVGDGPSLRLLWKNQPQKARR